jgi:hypothetical protein
LKFKVGDTAKLTENAGILPLPLNSEGFQVEVVEVDEMDCLLPYRVVIQRNKSEIWVSESELKVAK